jgi:hypothetical protein
VRSQGVTPVGQKIKKKIVVNTRGSDYLSKHSWPSPPIFLLIAIFLSRFVPPFWFSFSVLCARKLLLRKSLFLDKKLNQIDSIITHNFYFAQCLLHWMGGGGGG